MEFKKEILNYIKQIPELKDKGYYFVSFFFNSYGNKNPFRFGCHYVNKNFESQKIPDSEFFLIIENFKNLKKPDLTNLISEKIDKMTFYHDYIPNHILTQELDEEGYAFFSFIKGDKIYTIINLKPDIDKLINGHLYSIKNDKKLKKIIEMVLETKEGINSIDFDIIKYLPEEVDDWKLVTIPFLSLRPIRTENETHFSTIIQGNYKNNESYLNVGLKLFCNCYPEKNMIEDLKLPKYSRDLTKIKINNKNISFWKEDVFIFMKHDNIKKRFSISVFNNESTINRNKYENPMKKIMSKTIEETEKYFINKMN